MTKADPTSENIEAIQATFLDGERIAGYAVHASHNDDNGHFDVPVFSHIVDNLWMGGNPSGLDSLLELDDSGGIPVVRTRFDAIMCLYPWEEYKWPENVMRHVFRMFDSDDQTFEKVDELATIVARWLNQEARVLVHCQAGLNRSGLVTARALMIWNDMTAKDAIALIRKKRDKYCLCNASFEKWLLDLDE